MNIVLIISDTFHRDHLGCYGNKAEESQGKGFFKKYSVRKE